MGTIECNDEANNFKYKLVLETTVESLRLAIESKAGTSVAPSCYAFIEAVEGISTGGDCTDCENNLQSCIDAKALLETRIDDLNNQVTTLTSDLNTCTTDKAEIQSNLDDCIAEKAVIQDALDTANATISTINNRLDTLLGRTVAGDEIDKLDALDGDKLAIENAIVLKKGSELNDASDFSTYSTEIDNLEIYVDEGWDRPHDWIDMPSWEPIAGEDGDKMKILVTVDAVDGAKIGFNIAGNVTVDWGLGEASEDYSAGAIRKGFDATGATHQIIVEVTPQSGERFTLLNFNIRNVDNSSTYGMNEVKVSTDNAINLYGLASGNFNTVKRIEFLNEEVNATSLEKMTDYSRVESIYVKLKNDVIINCANIFKHAGRIGFNEQIIKTTSLKDMFSGQLEGDFSHLQIDATNATDASYLAYYSTVLAINIINTENITTMYRMLYGSEHIRRITVDMLSCTNALLAFYNNRSLIEINLTNCSTSIDIKNATALPAEQINYFILNGLVDVSSGDVKTVTLTGTVTEDELSQEALDHAVAYGWDLIF